MGDAQGREELIWGSMRDYVFSWEASDTLKKSATSEKPGI